MNDSNTLDRPREYRTQREESPYKQQRDAILQEVEALRLQIRAKLAQAAAVARMGGLPDKR